MCNDKHTKSNAFLDAISALKRAAKLGGDDPLARALEGSTFMAQMANTVPQRIVEEGGPVYLQYAQATAAYLEVSARHDERMRQLYSELPMDKFNQLWVRALIMETDAVRSRILFLDHVAGLATPPPRTH
jgi:hypothetical protein